MNHPKPYEINTDQPFWNICDGMSIQSSRESTVRIFCCAAQKHSRWNLTREELGEQDASGKFSFNGLIREGWFQRIIADQQFVPTSKMFDALMANGLIYEEDDDAFEDEKPTLILFKVRVIFQDRTKRNCWFTLLDVNTDAAEKTIAVRVRKYRHVLAQRGPVERIDVSEFKGPFEAGQIIAEER